MNLTEWIIEEDLSIKEFAEEFSKVVKENFGKHNYKCVIDIVNNHLANGAEQSASNCNKHNVSKRYLLEVITSKGNSLHCSVYDDYEKAQQMFGVLEHEWLGSTTEVRLTPFNAC